jgi:hypothetical protein
VPRLPAPRLVELAPRAVPHCCPHLEQPEHQQEQPEYRWEQRAHQQELPLEWLVLQRSSPDCPTIPCAYKQARQEE